MIFETDSECIAYIEGLDEAELASYLPQLKEEPIKSCESLDLDDDISEAEAWRYGNADKWLAALAFSNGWLRGAELFLQYHRPKINTFDYCKWLVEWLGWRRPYSREECEAICLSTLDMSRRLFVALVVQNEFFVEVYTLLRKMGRVDGTFLLNMFHCLCENFGEEEFAEFVLDDSCLSSIADVLPACSVEQRKYFRAAFYRRLQESEFRTSTVLLSVFGGVRMIKFMHSMTAFFDEEVADYRLEMVQIWFRAQLRFTSQKKCRDRLTWRFSQVLETLVQWSEFGILEEILHKTALDLSQHDQLSQRLLYACTSPQVMRVLAEHGAPAHRPRYYHIYASTFVDVDNNGVEARDTVESRATAQRLLDHTASYRGLVLLAPVWQFSFGALLQVPLKLIGAFAQNPRDYYRLYKVYEEYCRLKDCDAKPYGAAAFDIVTHARELDILDFFSAPYAWCPFGYRRCDSYCYCDSSDCDNVRKTTALAMWRNFFRERCFQMALAFRDIDIPDLQLYEIALRLAPPVIRRALPRHVIYNTFMAVRRRYKALRPN